MRQFPEGPQYSYVDTFALETPTDAVYFREAFLLLIKRTELFEDVSTVYLVGDNGIREHSTLNHYLDLQCAGPHFKCYETLLFQSHLWDITTGIYKYVLPFVHLL